MSEPCDAEVTAILHTRTGAHCLLLRLADTFIARFKGLMLSRVLNGDHGLLISRCTSVHTCLMCYAIDLVYLDRMGVVVGCVHELRPWRCSMFAAGRAAHVLELAAGTICRLDLRCGDRLEHPLWRGTVTHDLARVMSSPERGSAMIEFAVVGPIITLLGMAILQYDMLFFAKNQINHAGFMAARAGAMSNASIDSVRRAYVRAMVPLYGGGLDTSELAQAWTKANSDIVSNARIELLNPTRESFDDWNDEELQKTIGNGKRVIPNSGQAYKDPNVIKPNSGQNIQDANLIKIRITHGYEMKVPLISTVMQFMLRWSDDGNDPFITSLYENRRIPVVSHVTLQMQSEAIEPDSPLSMPGQGNEGQPQDPGEAAADASAPPNCLTIGCTVISAPYAPGGTDPDSTPGSGPSGYMCPPGDPNCSQMCIAAAGPP